ncbi:uncharacterized protein K460DRAFT_308018 [Cucurbitaria berberidis CBS 394.84]|uniref:Uncharacterized protein n=1 Tax=Cucurbitaria berberidis CBS 394.84 TaxID=1168544 RepID=A0A9P4GKP9_9PLEO|nr:uncharacterized protein K460DRAFT_308018 [Cucurbitaria berberidis CBS 394.84]KAF1848103.1 hypothetical protein K460DRAFT_308018 [Cucurbitaria berberidis CBS 394.84]
MFKHAIAPLTATLSQQLGHKPEYAALFLPSVLDDEIRRAGIDAIKEDLPNLDQRPIKWGPSHMAMCQGWEFLEGKYLSRPLDQCNDDGPINLILVLEYEESYLWAYLKEVDWDARVFPTCLERFGKECGERYREDIGADAYHERVSNFVDDFVNNQALQGYNRDDIRAIVIAGEASTDAVTELGRIAHKAVETETVKVLSDIETSEVVAHGAAVWAKLFGRAYNDSGCMLEFLTDEEYDAWVTRMEKEGHKSEEDVENKPQPLLGWEDSK